MIITIIIVVIIIIITTTTTIINIYLLYYNRTRKVRKGALEMSQNCEGIITMQ